MDIYVIMQVLILFGAIFLGVRLGGMGIGYAGGLGGFYRHRVVDAACW